MRRFLLLACTALVVLSASAGAQRVQDPNALAQKGVAALNEQRFGDALEAFTAAAKLVPTDPSLAFGAGVAAFRLGRFDDAEASLQRALKLNPRYTAASQWLGEVQYRLGRVKDAITTYETALKLAPNAPGLEQRVAEWQRETQLQDRFYESRGAHFSVLFEGPADDALARRVVERLEAAYYRIGGVLTTYPPQAITVILYTTEQFRDITRSPQWAGAVYDGRIRVPIRGALDQSDELDRVLGHEYVHAVVAMLGGSNVPKWLNEGLAVALEPNGLAKADEVLARTTARPTLRALQNSFGGLSTAQARVAYAESAHAVGRIIDLRGPSAIVILLQDLARGADFASAFQQRIFVSYDDFQRMVQ
jgi:tetratricopeptide (TPR) repeat protein